MSFTFEDPFAPPKKPRLEEGDSSFDLPEVVVNNEFQDPQRAFQRRNVEEGHLKTLQGEVAAANDILDRKLGDLIANPLAIDEGGARRRPLEQHPQYDVIEYLAGATDVPNTLLLTARGPDIDGMKKEVDKLKAQVLSAVQRVIEASDELGAVVERAQRLEMTFGFARVLAKSLQESGSRFGTAPRRVITAIQTALSTLNQPGLSKGYFGEVERTLRGQFPNMIPSSVPEDERNKYLVKWFLENARPVLRGEVPRKLDPKDYEEFDLQSFVSMSDEKRRSVYGPIEQEIGAAKGTTTVDEVTRTFPVEYRVPDGDRQWLSDREEDVERTFKRLRKGAKRLAVVLTIYEDRRVEFITAQAALGRALDFAPDEPLAMHPSVRAAMQNAVAALETTNDAYMGAKPEAFLSTTTPARTHFLRLVSLHLLKIHVNYPRVYRQTRVLRTLDDDIFRCKMVLSDWRHVNGRILRAV